MLTRRSVSHGFGFFARRMGQGRALLQVKLFTEHFTIDIYIYVVGTTKRKINMFGIYLVIVVCIVVKIQLNYVGTIINEMVYA